MTDPELQGIAAQALNMAKRDQEQGKFNFLVATYHAGEGVHRMSKIEAEIVNALGTDWLNSGARKDIGFGILQLCVALRPPDAIVFVTGTHLFKPTAAFNKLPREEQEKVLDGPHSVHHRAVRDGLLELSDAWYATAQTPERACMYIQELKPDARPEVTFVAVADIDDRARTKLFGRDPKKVLEELVEMRAQLAREE